MGLPVRVCSLQRKPEAPTLYSPCTCTRTMNLRARCAAKSWRFQGLGSTGGGVSSGSIPQSAVPPVPIPSPHACPWGAPIPYCPLQKGLDRAAQSSARGTTMALEGACYVHGRTHAHPRYALCRQVKDVFQD